jgi:thiosulfate/3-mercaptopyruvate sulfurtransferase
MTLIAPDELAAALHDPQAAAELRVVDVRWYLLRPGDGRRAYEAGHLPGAAFVDLDTVLAAQEGPGRHPLPSPAEFAARLGALGIGDRHRVVAYDDAGNGVAARLWWMLDALGHEQVDLLDGGMGAWLAADLPLTTEEPHWPPTTLHLAGAWPRTIDRETLAAGLGRLRILDGRAADRYRGEVEPIDPAAGHIPTAISAPTGGNLGPDGRFLACEALRARFDALLGDARGDPSAAPSSSAPDTSASSSVVVSCGSGVNACQLALAMRVAGLPDPLLYPGSFSDWSRAGLPVATGPDPGRPLG